MPDARERREVQTTIAMQEHLSKTSNHRLHDHDVKDPLSMFPPVETSMNGHPILIIPHVRTLDKASGTLVDVVE